MWKSTMLALAVAAAAAGPGLAADAVLTQVVKFAPGTSSKILKGSVKGYGSVEYVVSARAGETMKVAMKTSNASNNFNVLAPGADAALFNSSADGPIYAGRLPVSGDYKVQVYLMRNAARRSEVANYALTIGVAP